MNSRKTLTCNLLQLPQDIFRVIFQYLSAYELMKGEEAFLNNQELLSLYRSSLEGFTLKEEITIDEDNEDNDEELIPWIIDRKLLVEALYLVQLRDLEMNLLNQFRFSLKSITFNSSFMFSFHSWDFVPDLPPLGNFPSLTSATFWASVYFTNDQIISFFSHHPQLEIVMIYNKPHLSYEILPHLTNSCSKIKILLLSRNDWVNDETMSLLTQQRLFPNLKSLDIQETEVRNEESLRQFILSRPLLSGLYLPDDIYYSNDFLVFYLRQVIFPSILNHNNHNDLESHWLAISSLYTCFDENIFDQRNDVVNPEIFSVDILSRLCKICSLDTFAKTFQIFCHLSKFPSMIDTILQSQFIPFILIYSSPNGFNHFDYFVDILFRCGVFHDHFPLLVEKYRTNPHPLIMTFQQAIQVHFISLTTEELQIMIPIVLNELPNKRFTPTCLRILSKLLQEPSSQHLINPNDLLLSFKSIALSNYGIKGIINCLIKFISVKKKYRQLFIESNLFPRMMTAVDPSSLIDFINHCLSSRYELLVGHLVDSGLLQHLLSQYTQFNAKKQIESLFKRCLKNKNSKQYKIVTEMELPNELRSILFETGNSKKRTKG